MGKLKQWIVDHYKESTFNVCTHQKLPLVKNSEKMMTGTYLPLLMKRR